MGRGRILRVPAADLAALCSRRLVPRRGRERVDARVDEDQPRRDPRDRAWHREGRVHQDLGDAASGQKKVILSILTILSRLFHEAFAKKANMGVNMG